MRTDPNSDLSPSRVERFVRETRIGRVLGTLAVGGTLGVVAGLEAENLYSGIANGVIAGGLTYFWLQRERPEDSSLSGSDRI